MALSEVLLKKYGICSVSEEGEEWIDPISTRQQSPLYVMSDCARTDQH